MPFHKSVWNYFGGGASDPATNPTGAGVEMGEQDPLLPVTDDGRMTIFDWGSGGQDAPPSGPSGLTGNTSTEPRSSANWGSQPADPAYTGPRGTRGKGGITDASRSELDLGMSGGQDAPPSGASGLTGKPTEPRSGANWGHAPTGPRGNSEASPRALREESASS